MQAIYLSATAPAISAFKSRSLIRIKSTINPVKLLHYLRKHSGTTDDNFDNGVIYFNHKSILQSARKAQVIKRA